MLLLTTDESLNVNLSTTVQIDYKASWVDLDTSSFVSDGVGGSITSTGKTTIVDAPSSGIRQVKGLTLKSLGSASTDTNVVTARIQNSSGQVEMISMTLGPGEALHFEEGSGWSRFDANGNRMSVAVTIAPQPSWMIAPHFSTANLTSTKTITSGSSFALYLGKAPRALTSVQVRARVTTAAATITWAEVAVAKGSINIGGNPNLTVVGYLDVSATINSTGQKTWTVPVSSGQSVAAGDDLWILIGNSATTAAVMRAQSIADDLQVGYQASAAQRPSLIVGTGTAFTIEGATTLAAWLALGV